MPRPKGSTNHKPSKAAIDNYYRMLREAAQRGDINAAGKLIELHHLANRYPSHRA